MCAAGKYLRCWTTSFKVHYVSACWKKGALNIPYSIFQTPNMHTQGFFDKRQHKINYIKYTIICDCIKASPPPSALIHFVDRACKYMRRVDLHVQSTDEY